MTRSILATWTHIAGQAIAIGLALAACSDRPAPTEQAAPQAAASVVLPADEQPNALAELIATHAARNASYVAVE